MNNQPRFDLFASCPPGLELWLLEEVRAHGWSRAQETPGGVTWQGTWADVWRANLLLRGATRILLRLGSFRATSLAELESKLAEVPLGLVVGGDIRVKAEATCRKSKIYHSGAAAERLLKAAGRVGGIAAKEGIALYLRLDHNECTVSIDTSGELLHKRGFKEDVAGAPVRETMAALLLQACGYSGEEPVFDPMCGSGTFVTEAAEIAAGLAPGRARSFAFEQFATFDAERYSPIRERALSKAAKDTAICHRGSDRATGAISASQANAERAGLTDLTSFHQSTLREVTPLDGPKGLVIVNPPYGSRLGEKQELTALYKAFGEVMRERFAGWRVGLLTSHDDLAKATGLTWQRPGPWIPHGGLKVRLWQTEAR